MYMGKNRHEGISFSPVDRVYFLCILREMYKLQRQFSLYSEHATAGERVLSCNLYLQYMYDVTWR